MNPNQAMRKLRARRTSIPHPAAVTPIRRSAAVDVHAGPLEAAWAPPARHVGQQYEHLPASLWSRGEPSAEDLLETAAGLLHGRCAAKILCEPELLALPPGQQGKLRIRDVGVDLMKRLIAGCDGAPGISTARLAGQGVVSP